MTDSSNGYERGEFAIIPIRWDDRRGEIQFGERQGGFPGMRTERRFVVRRVGPGVAPMTAAGGVTIGYSGAPVRRGLA